MRLLSEFRGAGRASAVREGIHLRRRHPSAEREAQGIHRPGRGRSRAGRRKRRRSSSRTGTVPGQAVELNDVTYVQVEFGQMVGLGRPQDGAGRVQGRHHEGNPHPGQESSDRRHADHRQDIRERYRGCDQLRQVQRLVRRRDICRWSLSRPERGRDHFEDGKLARDAQGTEKVCETLGKEACEVSRKNQHSLKKLAGRRAAGPRQAVRRRGPFA